MVGSDGLDPTDWGLARLAGVAVAKPSRRQVITPVGWPPIYGID